jgi:murein DD-endopeptidase MepM/ murein hydrolase activator NlpD
VSRLESQLAVRRERLAALRELYQLQTRRLTLLTAAHTEAQRRLEERLVELYESGEPDQLAVFFQAESLDELIEQVKFFNDIAQQDRSIANEIKQVKGEMRVARRKTATVKAEVAEATRILAAQTAEERAARDRLVAQEAALASARASKASILTSVKQDRHEAEEDLAAMQAASAAITAKIQSAQSQAGAGAVAAGTASSSGLVWPVSGVLTSTYGWRWGRMHEGIDIAAPGGTPIHAAAAGTVIYAGWLGGYGNMVIIDHGGGLATAYAHQSAIYITAGSVSQGQVVGAVGTTGHSTGNHLHFEVRINGSAVDPLGYL